MKRLAGKNVVITGAGRGQGRSHAIRCAAEGANVVLVDICRDVPSARYGLASQEDLEETVRLASKHETDVLSYVADVRDANNMKAIFQDAAKTLNGLDAISVNASIAPPFAQVADAAPDAWEEVIGVNLTGAFNSAQAIIPHLRAQGSGSIVFTSSVAGAQGMANLGAYVAAKHGVVGLMRTLAIELGRENIRVNALLPTSVSTPMLMNEDTYRLMRPDLGSPDQADITEVLKTMQLLPIPYVEAEDVTNALIWLISDEARFVTGVTLPIDGGALLV